MFAGEMAVLAGHSWSFVKPGMKVEMTLSVWEEEEEEEDADEDDGEPFQISVKRREYFSPHSTAVLMLLAVTGEVIVVETRSSDTVEFVKARYTELKGIPTDQFRLVFAYQKLQDNKTLLEYGIVGPCIVYLDLILRGGKPVIYLFPPHPLPSVDVALTLSSECGFSALYPVAKVERTLNGSKAKWIVSANSKGELVEKGTGLELSYLFWEAHTTDSPVTPPASINGDVDATEIETFHPSRPILNSSNSILLPFDAFLLYLDTSLKSLTLHTATRNDFVTYWLPSFIRIHEKGQLISMRFVEQGAYEQAAVLEVEPKPDVVTRVFMLFKGVDATELGWRRRGIELRLPIGEL